ncbi:MAG: hypothetical protein ACFFBP_02605, partial [Promethearchaeota archaeon]
ANFIRKLDHKLSLGDALSHWMAIYAMDFNGIAIQKKYSFIKLFDDFTKLKDEVSNLKGKSISILLPYNYLKKEDPLPHSWDVTSDSICLFFAKKLGFNECYLIKDVDGLMITNDKTKKLIKNVSTEEYKRLVDSQKLTIKMYSYNKIKKSVPIDSFVLTLISQHKISCIILNGTRLNTRIIKYFEETKEENKYYSKIF